MQAQACDNYNPNHPNCVPLACQHPRPYPLSPPTHPQLHSTLTCGSPFRGHGAEIPEAVNYPTVYIMSCYVVARYGCPYRVPYITTLCKMSGFPGGTMTPKELPSVAVRRFLFGRAYCADRFALRARGAACSKFVRLFAKSRRPMNGQRLLNRAVRCQS